MNKTLMLLASISKFLLSDDDKKIIIDALDWTDFNALLPLLYRHKIHHLFLKHIIDLEIADEIPYAIVNAISMQHSYLQFKHNEYMSEVCIVSEGLDRRQIPYVLLKGIGLSNTLFCHNKNIFRDYNDIDFLVEKSNVKKVDEILQGLGYIQGGVNSKQQIIKSDRKTNIYYSLNTHQEQAYVKFSKRYPLNCTILKRNYLREKQTDRSYDDNIFFTTGVVTIWGVCNTLSSVLPPFIFSLFIFKIMKTGHTIINILYF